MNGSALAPPAYFADGNLGNASNNPGAETQSVLLEKKQFAEPEQSSTMSTLPDSHAAADPRILKIDPLEINKQPSHPTATNTEFTLPGSSAAPISILTNGGASFGGDGNNDDGAVLLGVRNFSSLNGVNLPKFVKEHNKTLTFPEKLMLMLTHEERKKLTVSNHKEDHPCMEWVKDGQAFAVRDKDALSKNVLPLFFGECKFSSFRRKLYRWGFRQVNQANCEHLEDKDSIFGHKHFQRNNKKLMVYMRSVTAAGRRRAAAAIMKKRNMQRNAGNSDNNEDSTNSKADTPSPADLVGSADSTSLKDPVGSHEQQHEQHNSQAQDLCRSAEIDHNLQENLQQLLLQQQALINSQNNMNNGGMANSSILAGMNAQLIQAQQQQLQLQLQQSLSLPVASALNPLAGEAGLNNPDFTPQQQQHQQQQKLGFQMSCGNEANLNFAGNQFLPSILPIPNNHDNGKNDSGEDSGLQNNQSIQQYFQQGPSQQGGIGLQNFQFHQLQAQNGMQLPDGSNDTSSLVMPIQDVPGLPQFLTNSNTAIENTLANAIGEEISP